MSLNTETPTGTGPLVYTVEQAAAALGIGRNAVYEEIAGGRLKSFTHGRRRRIAHDDLVAFVNALRRDSAAQPVRPLIAASPRRAAAAKAVRS